MSLEQTFKKVFSWECGLVSAIFDAPVLAGEPNIFVHGVRYFDPEWRTKSSDIVGNRGIKTPRIGSGAGLDAETSIWATLGETFERYAAMNYDEDALVRASQTALGDNAVPLGRYGLFSEEQYNTPGFPYKRPDPNREIDWVLCDNMGTGEQHYIPALLIWLGYRGKLQSLDEYIFQINSNGLACGPTLDVAAYSGVREVLERDAFMGAWLLKHRGRPLHPNILERSDERLKSLLKTPGLDFAVADITTEFGVPCYAVFASDTNRQTMVAGAACHMSPTAALEKAVVECCHTRAWSINLNREDMSYPEVSEINDFEHHVRYYTNPVNVPILDYLWADGTHLAIDYPEPEGDVSSQLAEVVTRLNANGYYPYRYDLTTSDVASLGMKVARIVVPGTLMLTAGAGLEPRDMRRLKEMARTFGLTESFEINTHPHPFP